MPIYSPTAVNIELAAEHLCSGGLVGMPTETVYGLAANALDEEAFLRIFALKKRPLFDPLIVHVANEAMMKDLVIAIPDGARVLMEAFWPGPLTIILPKSELVSDKVTAGLPGVAIRMPEHPVALALIKAAGLPLTAPSANPFTYISPTSAEHVDKMFGEALPYVLDGGTCREGLESSIVDFSQDATKPKLLRPGAIPLEKLREVLPGIELGQAVLDKPETMLAPGQLLSHYAPKTPLVLIEAGELPAAAKEAALIHFGGFSQEVLSGFAKTIELAPSVKVDHAGQKLFAAMHELDTGNFTKIYAEKLPEEGLGRAIMDRLKKAARKGV